MEMKDIFDIRPDAVSRDAYEETKKKWDRLSKPIDGLGDFEELLCRIAAIKGDVSTEKRALVIMCGDNGIVEEGISQSKKDITLSVARAMGKGISPVCHMACHAHADVFALDIGIDSEETIEGVYDEKIRRGTGNFLKERALAPEEAVRAIETGIRTVSRLSSMGYDIIATGEMGIGNTTTSTCILSALTGMDSDSLTGRGAGLSEEGLKRKREVIKKGLSLYDFSGCEDGKEKAFQILAAFGGLDIAGLSGVFIGGTLYHIPVIIDGYISAVAALLAEYMVPGVKEYMIASHGGREKGCETALMLLGLHPYIQGNMALGEGTGAVMLLPLIDMVTDYYKKGALFGDYDMEDYKRY